MTELIDDGAFAGYASLIEAAGASPLARTQEEEEQEEISYADAMAYATTDFQGIASRRAQADTNPETMAASEDTMQYIRPDSFDGAGQLQYLSVFNKRMGREELEKSEVGRQLMEIAHKDYQGRAGFLEGVSRRGLMQLVPYANDIYATGLTVKQTYDTYNTFKKINEGGDVTDEDLLRARLFLAEGDREAKQTNWGMFGGIVAMAPAFGGEIASSLGLGTALKKGAAKVTGKMATAGMRQTIYKAARKLAMDTAKRNVDDVALSGVTKLARSNADDLVLKLSSKAMKEVTDPSEHAFLTGLKALSTQAADTAEQVALSRAGKKGLTSAQRASVRKLASREAVRTGAGEVAMLDASTARKAAHFANRAFIKNVADAVDPDFAVGEGFVAGVRKAASVLYRGALQGGYMLGVDEVAHAAMAPMAGVDRIITPQELMLTASGTLQGYQDLVDNARMLSMGMRWAEYFSEMSGPAFDAIGGGLARSALKTRPGRAVAKGAKSAKGFVSRSMDDIIASARLREEMLKPLAGADIRGATESIKEMATRIANANAVKSTGVALTGEAFEKAVQVETEKIYKTLSVPVFARMMAKIMSKTGIGPQEFTGFLSKVGYHGVVEEMGEESFNAFVQGIFGLDDHPSRDFGDRLYEAVGGAAAHWHPGKNEGFWAQVAAFALPAVARNALMSTQTHLMLGPKGKAVEVARIDDAMTKMRGSVVATEEVSLGDGASLQVARSTPMVGSAHDADSPISKTEKLLSPLGIVNNNAEGGEVTLETIMTVPESSVDKYADLGKMVGRVDKGMVSPWRRVGAIAANVVAGLTNGQLPTSFNPLVGVVDRFDPDLGQFVMKLGEDYTSLLDARIHKLRGPNSDVAPADVRAKAEAEVEAEYRQLVGERLADRMRQRGVVYLTQKNRAETALRMAEEDGDTSPEHIKEKDAEYVAALREVASGQVVVSQEEADAQAREILKGRGITNPSEEVLAETRQDYIAQRELHAKETGLKYHRSAGGSLYFYSIGGAPHAHDSKARQGAYRYLAARHIPLETRIGHDLKRGGMLSSRVNAPTLSMMRRVAQGKEQPEDYGFLASYYGVTNLASLDEREAYVKKRAKALVEGVDLLNDSLPIRSATGTVLARKSDSGNVVAEAMPGGAAVPSSVSGQEFMNVDDLITKLNGGGASWAVDDPAIHFTPTTTYYSEDALDILAFMFESQTFTDAFNEATGLDTAIGPSLESYLLSVQQYNASPTKAAADAVAAARADLFRIHELHKLAHRALADAGSLTEEEKSTLYNSAEAQQWAASMGFGLGMESEDAKRSFAKHLSERFVRYRDQIASALDEKGVRPVFINRAGERAWAVRPFGVNSGSDIFVSAAGLQSLAVVAEEFLEAAFRKRQGLAAMRQPNGEPGMAPAAKRFAQAVQEVAARMILDANDDPTMVGHLQVILGLASSEQYNPEFMSKVATAVILRATAPQSFGYPALGAMADELRRRKTYAPFLALLEAMLGGNPAAGFHQLTRLATSWSDNDATAAIAREQIADAHASYATGALSAKDASTLEAEAFEAAPWNAVADFLTQYDPGKEKEKDTPPPSTQNPELSNEAEVRTDLDTGRQDQQDVAEELNSDPNVAENAQLSAEDNEKTIKSLENALENAEAEDKASLAAELEEAKRIRNAATSDLGDAYNLGTIVSDAAQAQAMLRAAMVLAHTLPQKSFPGLSGGDDSASFALLRTSAGNPVRSLIDLGKRGQLTATTGAAIALLSRWYPDASNINRMAAGQTLAQRWAATAWGDIKEKVAEADGNTEKEEALVDDVLSMVVGEVGSVGKLDVIEKSKAYRAFINVAKMLSPADRSSESIGSIVMKMRGEAESIFGADSLVYKVLDRTQMLDKSEDPLTQASAYSRLVRDLLTEEMLEKSPRLFALGVTLQSLGPRQGSTLLPYLRSQAPAALMEPVKQDGVLSLRLMQTWQTVGADAVGHDLAIRFADNLLSANPVEAGRQHVDAVTTALTEILGNRFAEGGAPAESDVRDALNSMDDSESRERIAKLYDAIYGTRENRVSAALRDSRVMKLLQTRLDPISPTGRGQAVQYGKEIRGLVIAGALTRNALTDLYKKNAEAWRDRPAAQKNIVTRASLVETFERGLIGRVMDGKDAWGDIAGGGLVSGFLGRAARTQYKTRHVTSKGGEQSAVIGTLAGVPLVVDQIISNIDAGWLASFGVSPEGFANAVRNIRRDGVYPDGVPVVSNLTSLDKVPTPEALLNALSDMLTSSYDSTEGYFVLPMYFGGHQNIAVNLPMDWVRRLLPDKKSFGRSDLNLLYKNMATQLAPVLDVPVKRLAQTALGTHMETPYAGTARVLIATGFDHVTGRMESPGESSEGLNGMALYSLEGLSKFHVLWGDGLFIKASQQRGATEKFNPMLGVLQKLTDKAATKGPAVLADPSGAKNNPFFGKQAVFVHTPTGVRRLGEILADAIAPQVEDARSESSDTAKVVSLSFADVMGALDKAGFDATKPFRFSRTADGRVLEGALDELAPNLSVEVIVPPGGGEPLMIPQFDAPGLSFRIAASIGGHSRFETGKVPANLTANMFVYGGSRVLAAVDTMLDAQTVAVQAATTGVSPEEVEESRARLAGLSDPILAAAMRDRGVFSYDRGVARSVANRVAAEHASLSSIRAPYAPLADASDGRSVVTRDGDHDVTEPVWTDSNKAFMKLDSTFGSENPFIQHSYVFTKAESREKFGGLKRRLTLTSGNIKDPWTRYATFLKPRKGESEQETLEHFIRQVVMLPELRHDQGAYNRHVRENIAPLVVDYHGDTLFDGVPDSDVLDPTLLNGSAMKAVSFDDLIIENPDKPGEWMFDYAAVYAGADAPKGVSDSGGPRVMIAGSLMYGERTPSASPGSGDLFRLSIPRTETMTSRPTTVEMVAPDGTVQSVKVTRPHMEIADDGIITKTPELAFIAGSDFDGDKTAVLAFSYDPKSGAIHSAADGSTIAATVRSEMGRGAPAHKAVTKAMDPYINKVAHARTTALRNLDVARNPDRPDLSSPAVQNRDVRYTFAYTVDTMPITAKVFPAAYNASRFSAEGNLSDYREHESAFSDLFDPEAPGNIRHLLPRGVRESTAPVESLSDLTSMWEGSEGDGYADKAMRHPPAKFNPLEYDKLMELSYEVNDIGELGRSLSMDFINVVNTIQATDAWSVIRPKADPPSHRQFRRLVDWADKIANSAFDVENEGTFGRAQFSTDLIQQYYAGLISRNWNSEAELLAYHDAWMLWANSEEAAGVVYAREQFIKDYWGDVPSWAEKEGVLSGAKAVAGLAHFTNKHPKSVKKILDTSDKLDNMALRMASAYGGDISKAPRHALAAMALLERRLRLLRDAHTGDVDLTPTAMAYREHYQNQQRNKDKKEAFEQDLVWPAMFTQRLSHATDTATAFAMLSEAGGGELYRQVSGLSVGELVAVAETAFSSLRARSVHDSEHNRTSPLARLSGNRFLRALTRRAVQDEGSYVYTGWFRSSYADYSTDIDGIRADYFEIAKVDAKVDVTLNRADGAPTKFEFTPAQILDLLFAYNALTSSHAELTPGRDTGFGFMFPSAMWREFTERRSRMLSERNFFNQQTSLNDATDTSLYESIKTINLSPRHRDESRGLFSDGSVFFTGIKAVSGVGDGQTFMQTEAADFHLRAGVMRGTVSSPGLQFSYPLAAVPKANDAIGPSGLPSASWLQQNVPQTKGNAGISFVNEAAAMRPKISDNLARMIGFGEKLLQQGADALIPKKAGPTPALAEPTAYASNKPLTLPTDNYVVVDTETTGLDAATARPVQLSYLVVRDGVPEQVTQFIRMDAPVSDWQEAADVSQWTPEQLEEIAKRAPMPEEVIKEFVERTQGLPIVGHNAQAYDREVLVTMAREAGVAAPHVEDRDNYVDTMLLYQYLSAKENGQKIEPIGEGYTSSVLATRAPAFRQQRGSNLKAASIHAGVQGVDGAAFHDAQADVLITHELFKRIRANEIALRDPDSIPDWVQSPDTPKGYNLGAVSEGSFTEAIRGYMIGGPKTAATFKTAAASRKAVKDAKRTDTHDDGSTTYSVTGVLGIFDQFLGRQDKARAEQGVAAHALLEDVCRNPTQASSSAWAENVRQQLTTQFPPSAFDYVVEQTIGAGRLTGRVDLMLVNKETGEVTVTDFKPFRDEDRYRSRAEDGVSPLDHHSAQVFVYQNILRKNGFKVADSAWVVPYDLNAPDEQAELVRADMNPRSLSLAYIVSEQIDPDSAGHTDPMMHDSAASVTGLDHAGRTLDQSLDDALRDGDRLKKRSGYAQQFEGYDNAYYAYANLKRWSEAIHDEDDLRKEIIAFNAINDAIRSAVRTLGSAGHNRAHSFATVLANNRFLTDISTPGSNTPESILVWRRMLQMSAKKANEAYNELKTQVQAASATPISAETVAMDQLWSLHKASLKILNTMEKYWEGHTTADVTQLVNAMEGVAPPTFLREEPLQFLPAADPYSGGTDFDLRDPLPKRMLSEPDFFNAMIRPTLGSRPLRAIIQEKGIQNAGVTAAEYARKYLRRLGLDNRKFISPMKEVTAKFTFDPVTGQHRELREGDEGYGRILHKVERVGLMQNTAGYLQKTSDQHDLLDYAFEKAVGVFTMGGDRVITPVDLTLIDWVDKDRRPVLPTAADVRAIKPGESKTKRADGNDAPVRSLEVAVTQIYDTLPAALREQAVEALAQAVNEARLSLASSETENTDGDVGVSRKLDLMNQRFFRALEKAGFGKTFTAATRVMADDATNARACTLTIPVTAIQEAFDKDKGLHDLLVRSGRSLDDFNIRKLGKELKQQYAELNNELLASAPYMLSSTDARRLFDLRNPVPFIVGGGAYRVFNEEVLDDSVPTTTELVEELRNSLDETLKSGSSTLQLSRAEMPGQMLRLFKSLAGIQNERDSDTWEKLRNGSFANYGVTRNASLGDLGRAIYNLALRRVSELALRTDTAEGTATTADGAKLAPILESLRSAASRYGWDVDISGLNPNDVYERYGYRPANLGAAELLTNHATKVAMGLHYKYALNNALLMADPQGKPLVYARPGEIDDGTFVGDDTWTTLATWWAKSNGWEYDATKSGRENAKIIYERIENTPDLVTDKRQAYATFDPRSGNPRTLFRRMQSDATPSVPQFLVRLDDPGSNRDGLLAAWQGGSTVAWMGHLLQARGVANKGQFWEGVDWLNNHVKSVAMSLSMFHLVAVVGESSTAAQGSLNTVLNMVNSDAARKFGRTKAGKKFNINENTMGMWNVMDAQLIVDDPWFSDVHRVMNAFGITLSTPTKNPWDIDKAALRRDLNAMVKWAKREGVPFSDTSGKLLDKLLFAMQENLTEYTFQRLANAVKMTVAMNMLTKLRTEAAAQGRWFDPVREMRRFAPYINAEIGGIDPVMYPFTNPAALSWLRRVMLSWQWTAGAWEAAGGGVATRGITGYSHHPDVQNFMMTRWARMAAGVMYGVPMLMQYMISSIARGAGDDKNELWIWNNEIGRRTSFDITPLLRLLGKSERVRWMKDNLPFGGLIPAALGDDPTMGNRRYYQRFGKQAWEITRWFTDPGQNAWSKSSLPLQRMFVAITGSAPNSAFDEPFKGKPYGETFFDRLGYFAGMFTPMAVSSYKQNKDAGFLSAVGPVSKGVSASGAAQNIRSILEAYADPDQYNALLSSPNYWNNYPTLGIEWLQAANANGHTPSLILKDAIKPLLTQYYREVYASLPNRPTGKVDKERLAKAMASLLRLDFTYDNLLKSIAERDKRNKGKVQLTEEVLKARREGIAEAYWYPNGRFNKKKKIPKSSDSDQRKTRSADGGGRTSRILGSDTLPKTMFGYPISPLSPDDVAFFEQNPDVAGFFDTDPEPDMDVDDIYPDEDDTNELGNKGVYY